MGVFQRRGVVKALLVRSAQQTTDFEVERSWGSFKEGE